MNTSPPLRLVLIPLEQYAEYRYEVIFKAYKWDPQVKDSNTVSRHAVLISPETAQELYTLSERLSIEVMDMEEALLARPDLHKAMGFSGKLKKSLRTMTVYNRDKTIDRYLRACQNGEPMKTKLGSALGVSPSRQLGADFLENVVLKIGERWRPLQTSHTQSGSRDDAGRPSMNIEDLSESGIATIEGDGNNSDSRVIL